MPGVTGSLRRGVLVLSVMVLAVLLVAEGTTRALEPYLPDPLVYGDEATQVKVAQMDARGPACTDVVLAGNSMGRDAFDPAVFSAADPDHRQAYNASLDAASPVLVRRWLADEVLPRLDPATVVLTVASLDLNANGRATASASRAYDAAPATATGWTGAAGAWWTTHLAVARYRTELRDPTVLADAVARWRSGRTVPHLTSAGIDGVLGPAGEGVSRRALRYRQDAGTKAFTRDQLLSGYRVDPAQTAALDGILADLQQRGTPVAVLVLPVTDDYVALHPGGRADVDAFLSAVRATTDARRVPLVDLHAAAPGPDAFADTHHLNATGAAWLSATLPARLADAGVLRAPRCPA